MKKINIFLAVILLSIFCSCNNNKLDGIYIFEKSEVKKSTSFFDLAGAAESGRQMGCEMIGQFEFKNGKCYYSTMGIEQRADYEIDNGVLYLGSNALTNGGVGLKIIDENTLEYIGCIFRKEGTTNNKIGNGKTE